MSIKSLIFHKSVIFLILSLTFYAAQAYGQTGAQDTLSRMGYAYAKDEPNKLLFTEKSRFVIVNNEVVWSQSVYTCAKANMILAEKLYTKNGEKASYTYSYKSGYTEKVNKNDTQYSCFFSGKSGGALSKKSLQNTDPLMFDEGVISTILKNQQALQGGETISLDILVPERGSYYGFYLELSQAEGNETYTYVMYPSNFLIKAFLPDFFFTVKGNQLQRVRGMSKVGAELDSPEVVIKYGA